MKDKVQVSFYVNGTRRELNVKPYWNLLRALREELGITSVREGCSEGECGACTVLLNGEAVSSCLVLASSLNQDDQVTTLEGIGDNGALHPLQESFHNHGAAQCGFCTPGIILSSKSLLDQNPEPSREEISEAISGNLCRCTGYVKPIEAIYSTSRGSVAPHEPDEGAGREESGFSVVGKSALRVDGEDLVTARTRYVDDMAFPNMLHAKALLSKHHHALIRKLDVSKAESLPGVAAVLTAKDVPNNMYGGGIKDQPCLCEDRVRHLGDIVAVVAAEDPDIAEEAVKLIEVEYEELPAVFDPMEAMEPDAVQIHPHGNFVPGPAGPNKNRWQVRKGDVEAGLKEADLIIEDTFTTPMCEHVHIEPHVAIGKVDPQGIVVIYSTLQGPFVRAPDIAHILDKPLSKIRIIVPAVGGGFGGKNDTTIEPHVALLAIKTGRPVKWRWTRKEEFLCSSVRHPYKMHHVMGLKKDGTITAKKVTTIADVGAYCTSSPMILIKHIALSTGPYRVPNVSVDGFMVYTNKQIGGAFRGFGMTQASFAVESQMDAAARKLGLDPLEIRLKNALVQGDSIAVGQKPDAVAIKECIEKVVKATDYNPKAVLRSSSKRYKRGRGIGAIIFTTSNVNYRNPSEAVVTVNRDGSVSLLTGSTDVGQGSKTVLAQMASEILGVPVSQISVTYADTLTTPYDTITASSRVTFVTGNAVLMAAQEVREKVTEMAGKLLGANPENLVLADGKVFIKDSPSDSVSLAETVTAIYMRNGEVVSGRGKFAPPQVLMDPETGQGAPTPCYTYGAAIAEVEVDLETGKVQVLDLTACYDCGCAINPLAVEGQIEGGLVQGLGFTLMENMYPRYPLAIPSAVSLKDYVVPTSMDVPQKMRSLIHESHFAMGPFGAKGVGEVPLNTVAPAVVNAIYDAVGVRIKDLPVNPEVLLRALREQ